MSANVPALQGMHCAAVVAPITEEYVPAGQALHDAPPEEKYPLPQSVQSEVALLPIFVPNVPGGQDVQLALPNDAE